MTPSRHISSSRAHSDTIPTATPIFSGSSFSVVILPTLREVGIQDGGHKTGSTSDVAGFPDTRVAPMTASAFTTVYKTF